MKLKLLLLVVPAFISAFAAVELTKAFQQKQQLQTLNSYKQKTIVRCGPDWEALKTFLEETDIPVIPGAGNYKWKITTDSDSTQFYFNQGINMYYGFHIIEAMASFRKAEKFDPSCAMIHWAKALAYGPNINDLGYAASPDALLESGRAAELNANCTKIEKELIVAQQIRYSADSTKTREQLNQLYADKMKEAYEHFPASADVAALYADALMLQHPWDLWFTNGNPKAWTPRIRTVLEKLLMQTPNHPGANHYYIHVMEPSPYAGLATASADRLGKLTPALSHMVHMPSHIYLRTGHYKKGGDVNKTAVNSYQKMIPLYSAVTGNDFLYIIHNLHMQTNHALLAGNMNDAVKSGIATVNSIPKDYLQMEGALGNYIQYIHMTMTLVDVRFGRWDALLAQSKPSEKLVYATILYHFGRGMAFAHQMKTTAAKTELAQINLLLKDPVLSLPFLPFSPAVDGAIVAANLLEGTILLEEKNFATAIEHFSKASAMEEQMVYNEPRDWMLNPKHYLGHSYLQNKQWIEAATTFKKDLSNNNNNIWALTGLHTALVKQNKKQEADKLMIKIKQSANGSDVKISAAVF
ncbi:MAG: hypothetical protein K2Q24_17365 [Chitinophagaceae bacterium]|jgi:tetratricopeptide (TPR) repeat protein|nr:hypothetical protein [Chitinophagaceae bacterium]